MTSRLIDERRESLEALASRTDNLLPIGPPTDPPGRTATESRVTSCPENKTGKQKGEKNKDHPDVSYRTDNDNRPGGETMSRPLFGDTDREIRDRCMAGDITCGCIYHGTDNLNGYPWYRIPRLVSIESKHGGTEDG